MGAKINGNLVIYVRRYASIILGVADPAEDCGAGAYACGPAEAAAPAANGPALTPDTVFDNPILMNRQCETATVVVGDCKNTDTVRLALAKLLAPAMGYDKDTLASPNFKFINLKAQPSTPAPAVSTTPPKEDPASKLFDLCDALRSTTRLNLHLSTLDQILVRWAILTDSGVITGFKNQSVLDRIAPLQAAFKSDLLEITKPEDQKKLLIDRWWNAGDIEVLKGVIGHSKVKRDAHPAL